MKKEIYLLTIFSLLISFKLWGQSHFSELELKEDLLFYKEKLEQHHPNLYLYNSKEKFNHFLDSLIRSINQPLNEFDFYRKITLTSHLVKDGHTLILPSHSFVEHHNSGSKFLPWQIGIYKEQLYVKMNCTSSIVIEDGTIIDSINGRSSHVIINELMSRQVRDGNNPSYANWILDMYFREYYSYIFGHPDVYRISYTSDNVLHSVEVPALSKDSIYHFRQNRYPAVYSPDVLSKPIHLDYDSSQNIAILTLKDFHSGVLKREYGQHFKKEIKGIFESIFSVSPHNLVIDLRNNQGGDVKNGVILLSHLINQPFRIVEKYHRLKSGKLVRCQGPSSGYHKPNKKVFQGQVYVLVNGGSFSNSVIFSSCLREYSDPIFFGTETGGNPNVLAGYAKEFELPNTKIRVEIPTKQFIMTSLQRNDGNGLIPTFKIEENISDNIQQNDGQLKYLIKWINDRGKEF